MGVTKNETMVDELEEKHTEREIDREGKQKSEEWPRGRCDDEKKSVYI